MSSNPHCCTSLTSPNKPCIEYTSNWHNVSLSPKETATPCSPYCLLPPPSLRQHKCLCSKLIQLKPNPPLPAPPSSQFKPQPSSPHNHTSICLHKGGSSSTGWKQTAPCFPMVELVHASCGPMQSNREQAGIRSASLMRSGLRAPAALPLPLSDPTSSLTQPPTVRHCGVSRFRARSQLNTNSTKKEKKKSYSFSASSAS